MWKNPPHTRTTTSPSREKNLVPDAVLIKMYIGLSTDNPNKAAFLSPFCSFRCWIQKDWKKSFAAKVRKRKAESKRKFGQKNWPEKRVKRIFFLFFVCTEKWLSTFFPFYLQRFYGPPSNDTCSCYYLDRCLEETEEQEGQVIFSCSVAIQTDIQVKTTINCPMATKRLCKSITMLITPSLNGP